MAHSSLSALLTRSRLVFIVWCVIASFGVYFCMYAFRKPFNTGLYLGIEVWGIGYKTVLIVSQVFGYMLSKFAGIKVISELKPASRIPLIIALILIAEFALILFGIVSPPYNIVFLFINGLPLGMVYGIVFSFLEGRRFTEMIAMGLSISLIVSSGILKTIYLEIQALFPFITEFWMPATVGLLAFPLFLLFVWMLKMIPPPSAEDISLRTKREPMEKADKRKVLKEFGFPIVCLIIIYSMLTMLRDYRDNFSIEIWNEIDPGWSNGVLTTTEMISGFVVLLVLGSLSFVRSNARGFAMTNVITLGGILLAGAATLLFRYGLIDGFYWMLLIGVGMFLGYMAIQTVMFERMIAFYQLRANAGFFIYICDSIGYLGSVGLLLYKEFFMKSLRWSEVLMDFIYFQVVLSLILLTASVLFFHRRAKVLQRNEDRSKSEVTVLAP